MTTQPEALRLADALEAFHNPHDKQAAAELRRLHASCEDYAQHKQRQDQRVLELKAQREALLEALRMWLHLHEAPAGYEGKYGKALGAAIAAQQVKIDAAANAARAVIKAVEETK